MVMLPKTMTAIEISAPGGPEVLQPAIRPMPHPATGEVLIAVAAAGVNRADINQREGKYPPPPGAPDIPGLEVAGRIAELALGVHHLALGDEVCALVAGGGYATHCIAPAAQVLPAPVGLTLAEAAAIPEAFFTVWSNLFQRGNLKPNESVLVHGGASGVGTTAIQLAKVFNARVFATAGTFAKCHACEHLGADVAINYRLEDFAAVIRERTARRGVDVILDIVGGDYFQRNIDSLAPDGRLVSISFLRGAQVEVNFTPVIRNRLTITGSALQPLPAKEKGTIAAELRQKVWPLLERGLVRPRIHANFPLAAAAEAHRLLESSAHIGKVVLIVDAA